MEKKVITQAQYEDLLGKYDMVNYVVIGAFCLVGMIFFGLIGLLFMAIVGAFTLPRMKRQSIEILNRDFVVKDDIQQ